MNTFCICAALIRAARPKTNYGLLRGGIFAGIAIAVILLIILVVLIVRLVGKKKKMAAERADDMVPKLQADIPAAIPEVSPVVPVDNAYEVGEVTAAVTAAVTAPVEAVTVPLEVVAVQPVAVPVEAAVPVETPARKKAYVMLTNINDFSETYKAVIEDRISIGKKNCDINISNDKAVSACHCSISFEDGRYILTDNNSTNGTVYDDIRLTDSAVIADGGVLGIGRGKFRISFVEISE